VADNQVHYMLDLAKLRQETPGCETRLHFNNAGCSLSPVPVIEAVDTHLRLEQQLGGYEAAAIASAQTENFYASCARLLHCSSQEIAYVENSTRAWDYALHAIPFKPGEQILTGAMEYGSNYLELLHFAKRRELELIVIDSDSNGHIDVAQLQDRLTPRTRLIALSHVASHRGDIQPAAEVGRIARNAGVLFLLDGCQSIGQLPIDVEVIGCDLLCASGRKFLRGPRGTGFLYVREHCLTQLDPIFVDLQAATWDSAQGYTLRPDARRFECFERSVAGQLGLGAAVDYALALGLDAIAARIHGLTAFLTERLLALGDITLGERSDYRSGIITFEKKGESAVLLQQRLQTLGMNTSIARSSNARLDWGQTPTAERLRASVHYYNTEEEAERFVTAVSGR
jgi:cysteine desulfurase/selenocysteine lyase